MCLVLFTVFLVPGALAQDAGCFSGGTLVGAVVGAAFGALMLILAAYYLGKLYVRRRRGKHLVLSTDPENVKDEFAFDNVGFQEEQHSKPAWQHDAPTLPMAGKMSKQALDAEFTRPQLTASKDDLHSEMPAQKVQLWARDFTGLGFTAEGGAREGVRVHSVLRSGPAAAAGIQPGDKIRSVKISLIGCVLEDAVQILSLASPYPVELEVAGAAAGWRRAGQGSVVRHPLVRSGSTGDVATLEREARHLHLPHSPLPHSNNSTLETKSKGIKKIITEKIITTTTLERTKKDKEKRESTLERENEKNIKLAKNRLSEPIGNKLERVKQRNSTGAEINIIKPEYGTMLVEQAETQKRESDPKRGMKFGIRVLPPNVPDDGVIKKNVENGDVNVEKTSIDEPDKAKKQYEMRHENEIDKKPVVAKRREKTAPPVPNVRNSIKSVEIDLDNTFSNSKLSEQSTVSTFIRDDLNSSGIKRDENGIPQELPQHMFEAAICARNNRKSFSDLEDKYYKTESDLAKPNKKIKGKAPSPPEEKNKTDDSIVEQLNDVNSFLNSEKLHSSLLHYMPTDASYNTSTPKINKIRPVVESINFSQDDIDDIVTKPFKRESDSLNNFYEDSKSNLSSNLDGHSTVSLNNSDKGSTTIELNNSNITIHSSPTNDTLQSISDEASILDENERKATSLGDLSRFENRGSKKPSQGTLERAQSLEISADDVEGEIVKSPKRKAKSVVETTFFDSSNVENLPEMIESETIVIKSKEPRLSLNLAKSSAMEGLSTFQRNRLKKASEFGNLEDAIVKGSNSSIESKKYDSHSLQKTNDYGINIHNEEEVSKLGRKLNKDVQETSDNLARKIMDENMKVNFKLVSEFAKSTSDGSNYSSLENEPRSDILYTAHPINTDFSNSLSLTYDTNIPDDVKVSRHTLVNSLERPKSDMMKKLLAKNPALNVHIDQEKVDYTKFEDLPNASAHQPDVVNFNLKTDHKNDDDFVSNIRIGSNNNSLTYNKSDFENCKPKINKQNNIVTITTERTESPTQRKDFNHTNSIEIGDLKTIPDVIEGVSHHLKTKADENQTFVSSRTYFTEDPTVSTQEPSEKTVTVNMAEDEFGNKVITQNIEKISTEFINERLEAPLQIEQVTFGIIKNPKDIERLAIEEGENIQEIDKKILEEIKMRNPNMHFTTDEPTYSKTETIILNTNLDEANALALMDKLKNDPTFMTQKTPEELSQMGVRVIHERKDQKQQDDHHVELTKTRYLINPSKIKSEDSSEMELYEKSDQNLKDKLSQANKNHITEIQVMTPRTEKLVKQKYDLSKATQDKPRHRSSSYSDPETSYELDISLLNDFICNERRHSALELAEKREKPKYRPKEEARSPRHSDYDLPRNTQIKFRTATYESPKGTIVTSTDIENKRLSQMDQESRVKPVISAKPSSIPVKMVEKPPKQVVSPSKIPVFMTQKSLSQENLVDKSLSLPRSPPVQSDSSGNISVTSIKCSSKNPSGK